MDAYPPEKIRNVALVGHHGSGKTTLAEALLHVAGVTTRVGRVEDGTTVCDADPEEQRRGMSLSLALAPLVWKGHKINVLDTPGYPDFMGDVQAALAAADLAIFVVSAVDGVEVQTEAIWREAASLGLPRMVFINKLDRERADFERTLEDLRSRFGAGIAPLELPIGSEAAFHGVADLLSDTAYLYDDGEAGSVGAIPDEMEALEHQVHDNLVEGIVVADDELLAGYLEGTVPSVEALEHTLHLGVDDATVFPVICGSALTRVAIDRLADFICEIGPSPLERPAVAALAAEAGDAPARDDVLAIEPAPDAPTVAVAFKTVADQFVGQVTLLRVLAGTIKADDHLINRRTGIDERLHALQTYQGREAVAVPRAETGDLVAVAKLSGTTTGDTLSARECPVKVLPLPRPEALLSTAITARTQADDDKLGPALHRLLDEDPSLALSRDDETHQTLLRGVGETHLAITLEKLSRKFGVTVDTEPVQVRYRETITTGATAEGRHKKQSGGHGQFGVASLRIRPLERGEGFHFVDEVVGGAIPRQFIPAVQKGVEEAMAEGGHLGYRVVDVEVACFDGKYHPVDSSEMSFKMAGKIGFREALAQAGPVLLEPVLRLEVTVPTDLQGDVLGDLNARRGRVLGTEAGPGDGEQTILADVPEAEALRYAVELRSLTGGRGRFTQTHDHYDVVPANLVAGLARTSEP